MNTTAQRATRPKSPGHTSQTHQRSTGKPYNTPAVWTKNAPKASTSQSPVLQILTTIGRFLVAALTTIGRFLLALLALVGKGAAILIRALFSLLSRSRTALAIFVVVVALALGGLVDFGLNVGKAYPGVHVGELDVAGKNSDEISQLVDETYEARLAAGSVVIYANDDAATHVASKEATAQDTALAEQLAVEEAQANKLAWTADATTLNASIPSQELAEQALAVGRENGGLFTRLGSFFMGYSVEARAAYGSSELEDLAVDIDATIGNPRVDFGITVDGGVAAVTEGHDGQMIDREAFKHSLDQVLLSSTETSGSFVAHTDYAPLRINQEAAQATADKVNRALADGVQFTYNDKTWLATPTDVGAWVASRVEEQGEGYELVAYLNETRAKPSLLSHVDELSTGESIHVTFETNNNEVTVHTDGSGTIPLVAEAVTQLNTFLFGADGKASESSAAPPAGAAVPVTITTGSAPTTLTFDEAQELGIIGTVSSYTTEFTTGAGTENRNHNIALVSELLSNSIVKPGESWSFNKTAGECNEENGFLGAGAIVDGEYDDAVGGGICQVATTMFNAVFDSGFPVITRHNHSLYISSYPMGRDAAVSWPDLDLVWENDSKSDVLVRLSCVDGSVTATLYGVNPGYQVSSVTGDWSEGEHYTTKTKVDESLAPGTSYVKTRGTNGSTIMVVRKVTNDSGSLIHEDAFSSVYDPITEVVVQGPDSETDSTSDKAAGNTSA